MLRRRFGIFLWSAEEYREKISPLKSTVEVLTPQSVVNTLAQGYRPYYHSAYQEL